MTAEPPPDPLSLDQATRELRGRHGRAVTYARVWRALAQGDAPAFREGRLWRVRRGDLSAVAAALGLPPPSP